MNIYREYMGQRITTSLASRSIFRNSRRTLLTITLIACCLAALMFSDAMTRGYMKSMVAISTETFLGEAQLHRTGYRQSNDVDLYMQNQPALMQQLRNDADIDAFSPRIISGAMVSSSQNVSGAMVYGVMAAEEAGVSKLKQSVIAGQYLSGTKQELLLGAQLADILEVDLGDRIVITLSQADTGELAQELFRVSGITRFGDRLMDSGLVFINYQQAQRILAVTGPHQIALQLSDDELIDRRSADLWSNYAGDGIELLSWKELYPQINSMLEMSAYSTWIVSIIMYTLVTLGLVNTMFMSIFERHNEFGILLAIGTRPARLFAQIIYEGFFIGILGVCCGFILGYGLCLLGAHFGINFGEGLEFSNITFNEPIYLINDPISFLKIGMALLLVTILACIYPAYHAAKLRPSLAMRKPL
ncbi:ABC transporter permease [Thalassotalea mangrovi]|uniref:ABC transporter permease n=1 Tax=Thalassotalea mangrovi TaxID=2572245 RepID=A0A4V5NWL9_9GAMM|nr:FtsX-like permease family protein [Thalassotalea mangrovi]TKB44419.1 ABC transporter permease [Thalassotalea mangrovi]